MNSFSEKRLLLLFVHDRGLGRGKTGQRNPERTARNIGKTDAVAELHGFCLAALLPALFLYRRELVLELQKRLHR